MKTKHEHILLSSNNTATQHGNILLYVLIAIALFGALSFTLARLSRNDQGLVVEEAKSELYAGQLIAYASEAKSAVDQMMIVSTSIDSMDFTLPGQSGYNSAPYGNKIFHPQGGGFTIGSIPPEAIHEISAVPPAGWYMQRFNNVEWTKTSAQDVILTAYQITKPVCESINRKITGSALIPALNGNISTYLIKIASNQDLNASDCPACEGYPALCVSNSALTAWAFYSILAAQ